MTILNTYTEDTHIIGWFGAVVVGLILIGCILYAIEARELNGGIFVSFIALGIIILFLIVPAPKTRIQCTIDNTESFSSITERYNIISQSGLIWTLEEKVGTDNNDTNQK